MFAAKNKLNNSEQTAYDYAQMTADELARARGHLACPECEGQAYFRSATRNGRAPCFCGRHAHGCELAAVQTAARANQQRSERGDAILPWQRIVLDLDYGAHHTNHLATPRVFESPSPEHRSPAEPGVEAGTETRRRPRALLHELIHSPGFSESRQPFVVDGVGETTIADFFVSLERHSTDHIHQYHGFWGRITSVYLGSTDELWLNSQGYAFPGVYVPRDLVDEFYRRNRLNHSDKWRLEGAYVLAIGMLKSTLAGKHFVEVKDLANLAVSFPSEY